MYHSSGLENKDARELLLQIFVFGGWGRGVFSVNWSFHCLHHTLVESYNLFCISYSEWKLNCDRTQETNLSKWSYKFNHKNEIQFEHDTAYTKQIAFFIVFLLKILQIGYFGSNISWSSTFWIEIFFSWSPRSQTKINNF